MPLYQPLTNNHATKQGSRSSLLWVSLLLLPLCVSAHASVDASRQWLQQQFAQQLKQWQQQQPGQWRESRLDSGKQTLKSCAGELRLLRPLPANPLGAQRLLIGCDNPSWKQRLRVNYQAQAKVWLAKQTIQREQIIQQADLHPQWRWLEGRDADLVLQRATIIGQRSLRRIAANKPILASYLAPQWLVSKGQEVIIRAKRKGFSITSKGIALSSAGAGKMIQVRNARSGKIIKAYVVEKGVVETQF